MNSSHPNRVSFARMTDRLTISEPLLFAIGDLADEHGIEAYAVGGYVRDILLGREHKQDIDITVIGDGVAFAKKVEQAFSGARLTVFEKFRTAMIAIDET